MPKAVLQVELERLPTQIEGLDRYDSAFVLLRLRGRPVAQCSLPVVEGRISGPSLRQAISDCANWTLWEHWLRGYLGVDEVPPWNPAALSATVAVCTRDRPEDLERCLDALMALPDDGQHYLVIDNCPATEATRELVARFPRVRYVREPRPGLDVARNRALREATTDVVAFADDDSVPDPGWLRALMRNFTDGMVLCVTGLTLPLELETRAQQWFERIYPFSRGYQRRVFHGLWGDGKSVGRVGAGANMALRRSVVDLAGPFDEALDTGTPTKSGGDHEMFGRILNGGYDIVYDPSALSWHRHRRTWEELRRAMYGYGVGVYAKWACDYIKDRDLSVPLKAWSWFRYRQVPMLLRSLLRRPGRVPLDLVIEDLKGSLAGPWAYLASRRQARRLGSS